MDAKAIIRAFQCSREPDTQIVKQATEFLTGCEQHPAFCITMLQIIDDSSVSESDRIGVAARFQRYIEKYWTPQEGEKDIISEQDRATIKQHLVTLMLKAPKLIKNQLAVALVKISASDFPKKWPNLLPELVSKLGKDMDVNLAVFSTLDSMFRRYRTIAIDESKQSLDLLEEMKYVLSNVQQQLLDSFKYSLSALQANLENAHALSQVVQVMNAIVHILHSFNVPDINEFVEDHMNDWFQPFLSLLSFQSRLLDPRNSSEPGVLDKVC
jgi:exportin-2 (importin alpha re-exporter)